MHIMMQVSDQTQVQMKTVCLNWPGLTSWPSNSTFGPMEEARPTNAAY